MWPQTRLDRIIGRNEPRFSTNEEKVREARAELLYRHAVGGITVSVLASASLTLISYQQSHLRSVWVWWLLMTGVLGCRTLDLLWWRRTSSIARNSRLEMCHFSSGVFATACLWAAFPLTFMPVMNETGRACLAIVLSAMAGGAVTVLAASEVLAVLYCAALLLPASAEFLQLTGVENQFLGVLGGVFFFVMVASARVTHRATISAILLAHTNERLLREMEKERARTEHANVELKAAQAELFETNQSLATRVEERTADLARLANELAYLASTDPLTCLWNRTRILELLAETLAAAAREGRSVAVLFIDLDKFKEVNDVMGHFAGDLVLKTIAQRLVGSMPSVNVARWGGDEFVIAAKGIAGAEAAFQLAGAVRQAIRSPVNVETGVVTVDATIGIALFPLHGREPDQLIRASDAAMYASKQDKRSKIRLFEPSIGRRLTERHKLDQGLRSAILSGSLSLVFQPIIRSASVRCAALEALLRWRHPELGPIRPDLFIPIAEETGEILAIGRWVLRAACREALTWPGSHPQPVAVNVSPVQIQAPNFIQEIFAALEETGLPPTRLQLEITERLFAGDRQSVRPMLMSLRDRGIRISLDDFGTGFSCLANLHNLPVDQIKIDKSFVNAIADGAAPLVRAILTTSQALHLDVVAEGVETAGQALQLTQMGTPHLQGFFFSGVLSPAETRDWLAAEAAADTRAFGNYAG